MTLYQDSTLNFGMYKGFKIYSVPKKYITWLKENTNHIVSDGLTPKDNLTEDERRLQAIATAEDLHRRTCARIGRRLIYNNVLIPF